MSHICLRSEEITLSKKSTTRGVCRQIQQTLPPCCPNKNLRRRTLARSTLVIIPRENSPFLPEWGCLPMYLRVRHARLSRYVWCKSDRAPRETILLGSFIPRLRFCAQGLLSNIGLNSSHTGRSTSKHSETDLQISRPLLEGRVLASKVNAPGMCRPVLMVPEKPTARLCNAHLKALKA